MDIRFAFLDILRQDREQMSRRRIGYPGIDGLQITE
jgi:hypothetical protein